MKLDLLRKDGKSQKTLILLTIFFGIFGVDYFYLNKKTPGIVKLFLTWVGLTFMAFSFVILGSTFGTQIKIIPYTELPGQLQNVVNGVLVFGFLWIIPAFIWNIYNLYLYFNLEKYQGKIRYLGEWGATQKEVFENMLILE